jgi:hypothetical protein
MTTYPLTPHIDTPLALVMMKSPQWGNTSDPRGIEMESELMISETHIDQA